MFHTVCTSNRLSVASIQDAVYQAHILQQLLIMKPWCHDLQIHRGTMHQLWLI